MTEFDWATKARRYLAVLHPGSGGFERKLQFDGYTCAARSTQMLLNYYGRGLPFAKVKKAIGTTSEGTDMAPIERLLRKRHLACKVYRRMTMAELAHCLKRGVVLVQVDEDHVAVVHDIDAHDVHIADPAITRVLGGRQSRARFRERWDRWGMVVTDPRRGRPTPSLQTPCEVRCPVTREGVEVARADGEYRCPCCGDTIVVARREAEHE